MKVATTLKKPESKQGAAKVTASSKSLKYYKAKIELLEQENEILRNALEEIKRNLEAKEIEIKGQEEECKALTDGFSTLERAFVLAKSLISIPDNIRDIVEELIKTRLLIWDKAIIYGGGVLNNDAGGKGDKPLENLDCFEWFTDFNKAFKSRAKGKAKK